MDGCTIGAVWLGDELYFFKNHDVQDTEEQRICQENEMRKPKLLISDHEKELKEQGYNFPSKWPYYTNYIGIGIPIEAERGNLWIRFAGGMSEKVGFAAASAHGIDDQTNKQANEKWKGYTTFEWDINNDLRQGSMKWGSKNGVKKKSAYAARKISLYTNYLYCFDDDAIMVEFKGPIVERERLGKQPFMVRANHYEILGNEKPRTDKDFQESLQRYDAVMGILPGCQSLDDLMGLLCTDPINKYTSASVIGCPKTGKFWYCLRKPENPTDFVETDLKKP